MQMNRRRIRQIILEELNMLTSDQSEMNQFYEGSSGKKMIQAGNAIKKAAAQINDLGHNQTGHARRTMGSLANFAYKLGEAIASVKDLDEGASMTEAMPTVTELKKLIKEIQKLEKL